jgi:hypothetical protein
VHGGRRACRDQDRRRRPSLPALTRRRSDDDDRDGTLLVAVILGVARLVRDGVDRRQRPPQET